MKIAQIKKEIAGGNLEKSIEMLLDFFQYSGLDEENELYSQSSRLQRTLKNKRLGVVSEESASIVINQITVGLLELLGKIESSLDDSVLSNTTSKTAVKKLEFEIVADDILNTNSDIIALKYAQGFQGASLHVFDTIFDNDNSSEIKSLSEGMFKIYDNEKIKSKILLLGTSAIPKLSYSGITDFTKKSLELISDKLENIKSVSFTMHGVGYGLDEYESFKSQMLGFNYFLRQSGDNTSIEKIYLHELDEDRVRRLRKYLEKIVFLFGGNKSKNGVWKFELLMQRDDVLKNKPSSFWQMNWAGGGWANYSSEPKQKKVLVSIPFEEKYDILYFKAIQNACHENEMLSERINSTEVNNQDIERFKSALNDCEVFIVEYSKLYPIISLQISYAIQMKKKVIIIYSGERRFRLAFEKVAEIRYGTLSKVKEDLFNRLKE